VDKTIFSDQELVDKYLNGDHSSLEILILRHKNKVYNYIFMVVRNEQLAEDIFQDTFIKVINSISIGKYRDDGKFVPWIMRIAHNLTIDHFRKEKQFKTVSADACDYFVLNSKKHADDTIEDKIIDEQISSDVRKLLDYLPDDQREVIILRHFVGLSFKEIADQTNVSINTALGRMRYGLMNLRKMIAEKDICLSRI
jgi:RNA polymerase sigma factor (sigma-70 family)